MSEKVDVVYTLANLSKGRDDWELRYSLRSLAQQDWVRDIYLVGHLPAWAKDVWHVQCPDPWPAVKDANIIHKVLTACKIPELSGRFVINSDDHYILRSIRLEELGPWLENLRPTEEQFRRAHTSLWNQRLISTAKACREMGLPEWVFLSHIPYLVEKAEYPAAIGRFPWKKGNGVVTHAYYNAVLGSEPPRAPEGVFGAARHEVGAEVEEFMVRLTFFNHNNSGLSPAVKAWMEKKFPEPSPWEAR